MVQLRAVSHGGLGEVVAEMYSIGRTEQDDYAASSHARPLRPPAPAGSPTRSFDPDPAEEGADLVMDQDESVREDITADTLAALKAAPRRTHRHGWNAPGVNDGAAALVVMSSAKAGDLGIAPLVHIVGQATRAWPRNW